MVNMHNPSHPSMILKGLYLDGAGLTVTQAAETMGISRKTLSQIVNAKARISPQIAILLAQAFPTTTPQLWLNLQQQYDLWQVSQRTPRTIAPLWDSGKKTATTHL